jgi:hypothetical protein
MARTRTSKLRGMFADPSRVMHTVTSLVTTAIVVTVLATMVVGRGPLLAQAAGLRAGRLSVAFDWPPLSGKATSRAAAGEPATWMNAEQRRELEALALRLLGGDPFDSGSLTRTRDALAATGWFAEGPWLKRYESGLVVITGTWRAPAAAVRVGEIDLLVGAGGELLPIEYPKGRSGLKVIVGAGPAPAGFGERWPGGRVQAGLSLLAFLRPMPGFEQVEAVDVGEVDDLRRLSLLTSTGGRVLWGASPADFHPGQAAAGVKRDRLAAVHRQFGQLDAGRMFIDLRPDDGVYLQDDGYIARNTTVRK